MTTPATYQGYLHTGSGTQEVRLELRADTARVVVYHRWMGQHDTPVWCHLQCRHRPTNACHGVLELVDVTTADTDDERQPVPPPPDDEALWPPIVEYLRLPTTANLVHPESELHEMKALGYADWNDSFEVVLLVDDDWPDGPPWSHLRGCLDKAKLSRADD